MHHATILALATLALASLCAISPSAAEAQYQTHCQTQGAIVCNETPPIRYAPVSKQTVRRPIEYRKEFLIAELYFPLIDVRVKDVFIYPGPPLVAVPGLPTGFPVQVPASALAGGPAVATGGYAGGSPASAGSSVGVAGAPDRSVLRAVIMADETTDIGLPVASDSILSVSPLSRSSAPPLASPTSASSARESILRSRCASCHTQGSAKGGIALFDTSGKMNGTTDWAAVYAAVTSADGKRRPRMPPSTAGEPLTAAETNQLR